MSLSQLSLYKYFSVKDKVKLPHPTGLLSLSLSLSAIVAANRKVTKAVESSDQMDSKMANSRRGEYAKFSPAMKIELAKYAAQHGVAATLKHHVPKGKHSKNLERQPYSRVEHSGEKKGR